MISVPSNLRRGGEAGFLFLTGYLVEELSALMGRWSVGCYVMVYTGVI